MPACQAPADLLCREPGWDPLDQAPPGVGGSRRLHGQQRHPAPFGPVLRLPGYPPGGAPLGTLQGQRTRRPGPEQPGGLRLGRRGALAKDPGSPHRPLCPGEQLRFPERHVLVGSRAEVCALRPPHGGRTPGDGAGHLQGFPPLEPADPHELQRHGHDHPLPAPLHQPDPTLFPRPADLYCSPGPHPFWPAPTDAGGAAVP